jgi:hypothetical protein
MLILMFDIIRIPLNEWIVEGWKMEALDIDVMHKASRCTDKEGAWWTLSFIKFRKWPTIQQQTMLIKRRFYF